jgi:dimethylglycine dehydrogenase
VTSGGYGHCIGKSLAMGYIERAHADDDTGFEIEIIGERRPAVRLAAPAYDPAGAAMRS